MLKKWNISSVVFLTIISCLRTQLFFGKAMILWIRKFTCGGLLVFLCSVFSAIVPYQNVLASIVPIQSINSENLNLLINNADTSASSSWGTPYSLRKKMGDAHYPDFQKYTKRYDNYHPYHDLSLIKKAAAASLAAKLIGFGTMSSLTSKGVALGLGTLATGKALTSVGAATALTAAGLLTGVASVGAAVGIGALGVGSGIAGLGTAAGIAAAGSTIGMAAKTAGALPIALSGAVKVGTKLKYGIGKAKHLVFPRKKRLRHRYGPKYYRRYKKRRNNDDMNEVGATELSSLIYFHPIMGKRNEAVFNEPSFPVEFKKLPF